LTATEPSTQDLYFAVLAMLQAYRRVETVLGAAPSDLQELVKPVPAWTTALLQDRLRLADSFDDTAFFELRPVRLPRGLGEWLGYLYVVFGSSLGANMIAKRMAKHSNERVQRLTFFSFNASCAGRFAGLIRRLETLDSSERIVNALVDGAKIGFDDFILAADSAAEHRRVTAARAQENLAVNA